MAILKNKETCSSLCMESIPAQKLTAAIEICRSVKLLVSSYLAGVIYNYMAISLFFTSTLLACARAYAHSLVLLFLRPHFLDLQSVLLDVLNNALLCIQHRRILRTLRGAALLHLAHVEQLLEDKGLLSRPRLLQLVLQVELVQHVQHYFRRQNSIRQREGRIVPRHHHLGDLAT